MLVGSNKLNLEPRCKSLIASKCSNKYTKSQHRACYNSLSTNSLPLTNFDSVFKYGLNAVCELIDDDDSFWIEMYANAVRNIITNITTDNKHFDSSEQEA